MGGGVTRIVAAVGVRGFATTVQYDLGQNGANGIYSGDHAGERLPDASRRSRERQRLRLRHAVTGSPYATGAPMNAGSGAPYASTSSATRRPARPHRHRRRPEQPERHLRAGAVDRPEQLRRQRGCGNAAGCQLGAGRTTDGGTTWTFMAGSAGGSLKAASTGPGTSPRPRATTRRTGTTRASRSTRTTRTASSSTLRGLVREPHRHRLVTTSTCGYNGSRWRPRRARRPARARLRARLVRASSSSATTAAST